ncbi:histone-like nucleoid-structuring protein Lsr2 [Saccharothrix syringae]|uniref:Lsr2 family protein n=2 Tax=Saccharothrix syringae TaxID=103733 RepID=A0A5Q0H2P8_SACSY|nr:Lsr2 family protein [Saccharothrix syringae]QFZ20419.1 Lsr2 family protein [Saccharothrix syringae]
MARQTIVTLVDDLDGSEARETVDFALDGVSYSIDLSAGNADKLRRRLADFVASGRRSSGRKQRTTRQRHTRTTVPAGGDRAQNQAIREWARSRGEQISDRGRISTALIEQFQQAHSA